MASTSDPRAAETFLLSRAEDAVRQCERRSFAQFLGFLDQGEQQTVGRFLGKRDDAQWLFYGGYEDAERRLLGVFPSYEEPQGELFPLHVLAFHYRKEKKLTHRDVLGTLMSIGLRRESIGDILCGSGLSVVFLREEIAGFVCDQVNRIGGEGVRVECDFTGELPAAHSFEDISDTIASPRLDAVVKALSRCSREQAARLIQSEAVSIDHQPVDAVSHHVEEGATISIRGYGRYRIEQIGPKTQKGRLHLTARKYV